MSKLINVISGKGGTGKTLLTAVLADILSMRGLKVLVVDMDIFVCGITTMFFYENQGAVRLTKGNTLCVSNFFLDRKDYINSLKPLPTPAILRYPNRSFDILPALDRIDQNYPATADLLPNDTAEANALVDLLMRSIPTKEYDYIFFDNRAGYDPLVQEVHKYCDFSLCVEENDDISLITSDRLTYLLDPRTPYYRIRNKVRSSGSDQTLRMGIDFLGAIDFEMEVFNYFGTAQFWSTMAKTAYRTAVCEVWNELAKKEELPDKIDQLETKKNRGFISVLDKSFASVGLFVTLIGLVLMYFTLFHSTSTPNSMKLIVIMLLVLLGVFMMVLSVVSIPKLLDRFRRKD